MLGSLLCPALHRGHWRLEAAGGGCSWSWPRSAPAHWLTAAPGCTCHLARGCALPRVQITTGHQSPARRAARTAAPPPPSHHLYLAGAGWLGPGCSCVVENICLGSQTGRGRTNEEPGVARTSQSGSRLTGWRDDPEARKQEASLMDQ